MKRILILLLSLILLVGLAACDEADIQKVENENNNKTEQENNNNDNDNNNANNNNEDDSSNEDLKIGDTVSFDGLKITLNEVRNEPGGEFDEPEQDLFIVANITIENTNDEEENVSSIINIELKDEEGYSYNTTFLTEGTKGQLDGAIEAGGTLRGEVPFDVPESSYYELHFSDPFKSGKAIWKFNFDELN